MSQGNANARVMVSPLARLMCNDIRPTTKADKKFAETLVTGMIASAPVVVFSKPECPRCIEAKGILSDALSSPSDMKVLELTTLSEAKMAAVQDYLWTITGARTVPRIFCREQSLGGCDDLRIIQRSGRLGDVLEGKQNLGEKKECPEFMSLRVVYKSSSPSGDIEKQVEVATRITGLMLKSTVLTELGFQGHRFSDYYLNCNEIPFGSRTPIASHPFLASCPVIDVCARGEEAKAVGHT